MPEVLRFKDVLSNQLNNKRTAPRKQVQFLASNVNLNLHSPGRRLIELRMEHADLDAMIDRASEESPTDELMMRRLKKRRLALRDDMARIERDLIPDVPA